MRVVVAHDYLTQRGGAERVVLEIARAFPGSRIVTSLFDPARTYPEFAELEVVPLATLGFLSRDPRWALPILGPLFRRAVADADVVICSSSGFAHQISATGAKVVYCHNPPRWIYQWEDYADGVGRLGRLALKALRPRLTRQDAVGAGSATSYLANSRNVAQRVARSYGITAEVLNPPRGLEPDGPAEPVYGLEPGFLLTVGRPRGYKRTDLLKQAVAGMPELTLVAVGGASGERWPPNVRELTDVSDAQLRWLYRSASALLACSIEDFGLTPVEAFGFGKPVGAVAEGGYLETCVEGVTGLWLDPSSSESMRDSIRALTGRDWDSAAIRRHGEQWAAPIFRERLVAHVHQALRARTAEVW